jgi:hypothetical protein
MRDKQYQFSSSHDRSRQGSPQAEQKKKSGGGRDHLQDRKHSITRLHRVRDCRMKEKAGGDKSLGKKPGAGPATSKRRK